jgi:cytoplasmic iron level regulating protein YaaA (DUF328/UPF0246 family)
MAHKNREALYLVAYVGQKASQAAPAQDLYTSPWFKKARQYVKQHKATWFILSAQYGLVEPTQIIAPYNLTLNTLSLQKRRQWSNWVLSRLLLVINNRQPKLVIFLAGQRYREFIVPTLKKKGIPVTIPMTGLGIGQQLAWLSRALQPF